MKRNALFLLVCLSFALKAQDTWQSLKLAKMPEKYKTASILYRIGEYHASGATDVHEKITQQRIVSRSDGRMNVEVVNGNEIMQSIDTNVLLHAKMEIQNIWRNRASCWIKPDDILRISENLPDNYILLPVRYPAHNNEGPGVMNSDSYRDNGADGSGITIAVIDGGFTGLSEAIANGVAPPVYLPFDWPGTGLEADGIHGTACVETVYDHAPGAFFHLHKVCNATEFGSAIETAINLQVDIISHSMSWYNTGWDDNSGPFCAAVDEAASSDIIFFTSSGNAHGEHWQGNFDDDDDDEWHEWSGNDERNITLVPAGTSITINLQWDNGEVDNCYDLFLYDVSSGDLLESSTALFVFEDIVWENTTGSDNEVSIAVLHNPLFGTPEFEIFVLDDDSGNLEYFTTSGSTASPSNATHPNCISIGAVAYTNYGSPPGSDNITDYSSRGPTNGGDQAPDIVGPTNTTTLVYGGEFTGTSSATPNAAGATAAFWSGHPYLSDSGLRHILLKKAALYNDWGANGVDNIYGHGGVELYDYTNPSRYIDNDAGNLLGNPSEPYYNMQQADENAPDNALIIFLGGIYNAVAGFIFDRPLVYRSLIESAEVK